MPLDELLTVEHRESSFYGRSRRIQSIYTRSWALTSMVILSEGYRDRSSELLLAIGSGQQSEAAFMEVYNKNLEQVEKDLDLYVHEGAVSVTLPTEWANKQYDMEPRHVSEPERQKMLADLFVAAGQVDKARDACGLTY